MLSLEHNDLDWSGRCDCLLKLNQFWVLMKKGYACTVSFVRTYLHGVLFMQALNCLIYLPLLQCFSMFYIVVVVVMITAWSVMAVVLFVITTTTTRACVVSQERDRLRDELQQIGFCPAPCL